MGVTNAVTIDADGINPLTLVGPGAGGAATASAVLSDIGDIARGVRTAPFGRPTAKLTTAQKAPMQRHEGGYYIRLLARDKPGTAATIARRLARAARFHWSRSCSAMHGAPWRETQRHGSGPRHSDYLCDQRGCGAEGPCRGGAR